MGEKTGSFQVILYKAKNGEVDVNSTTEEISVVQKEGHRNVKSKKNVEDSL